jgi:hypothetical protein
MSLVTILGALGQLAAVVVVGAAVGALLWGRRGVDRDSAGGCADPSSGSERAAEALGAPERALVAVAGFAAFAAALMVTHILTGGATFGLPGIVPAAAAAVVWRAGVRGVGALGRRTPEKAGVRAGVRRELAALLPGRPSVAVVALGLALVWLYVAPVAAAGSGLRTGDVPWHGGWTEQLLGGQPVPTGPAPVYGANAYPWGLHAISATMVRLVPGTSVPVAAEALHVLVVVAIPLAGAVVARRIRSDAGPWGAAATGLIGGFGWLAARSPALVTNPSEARGGADLVIASPNAVYELLPPALPRELGLVLLVAAALLVLTALSAGRRAAVHAGLAAGLVGLVSVPMLVSTVLWSSATIFLRDRSRARTAAVMALAAAATFGLWAGPAVANYFRHGGFVNVTPELGMEWSLPTALGAWGLLLPLAAAGLWVALLTAEPTARGGLGRTAEPTARVVLAWAAVTGLLLVLARARAALEWDLAGNATLLHQGRVWPVAHLLAGGLAGAALAWGCARLSHLGRLVPAAAGIAVLAAGAVSPALASADIATVIEAHRAGFLYTRPDVAPGSFVRRAAARLGPHDVVEVRDSRALALLLWQFSGTGLAAYDDPRLAGNDLRIRYRDLAAAWDRRMAAGGFPSGFTVAPAGEVAGKVLEAGTFDGRTWALVRR